MRQCERNVLLEQRHRETENKVYSYNLGSAQRGAGDARTLTQTYRDDATATCSLSQDSSLPPKPFLMYINLRNLQKVHLTKQRR